MVFWVALHQNGGTVGPFLPACYICDRSIFCGFKKCSTTSHSTQIIFCDLAKLCPKVAKNLQIHIGICIENVQKSSKKLITFSWNLHETQILNWPGWKCLSFFMTMRCCLCWCWDGVSSMRYQVLIMDNLCIFLNFFLQKLLLKVLQ